MKRVHILVLGIVLFAVIGVVSGQGETTTRYSLDEQYGVDVPNTFQVLQQNTGLLVVGNNSLGFAFYSPAALRTNAQTPLDALLSEAANNLYTGVTVERDDVQNVEIDGREAAYIDAQQTVQGSNYNLRLYALRMSDGAAGVINVIAFVGRPVAYLADIEAVLAGFDVNQTDAAGNEATPEAPAATATEIAATATITDTPKPADTPTITPTPAPLVPESGEVSFTITPSDDTATCSIGFFPLGAALFDLTFEGVLVAAADGESVDFYLNATNQDAGRTSMHLERDGDSNQFIGSVQLATWTVDVRLELVASGRMTGAPTSAFSINSGGQVVRCVDNAQIIVQTI